MIDLIHQISQALFEETATRYVEHKAEERGINYWGVLIIVLGTQIAMQFFPEYIDEMRRPRRPREISRIERCIED